MSLIANIHPKYVPQLLASIENQGYAVLENAVTNEGLERFRRWIDEHSAESGKG